MTYSPLAVANSFIREVPSGISNVRLQKLLYFAHGKYLALTGKPLVLGGFQAWEFGPVSRDLYHEAKEFGRDAITTPFKEYKFDVGSFSLFLKDPEYVEDEEALQVIRDTLSEYGSYSASALIGLSHKVGSPWEEVYNGEMHNQIDDACIKKYFKLPAQAGL